MPFQASTCGMAPHKHLETVPSYSLLGYFTIIRAHGHGASRGVLRQCQDTAELAKGVVGLSGACRQALGLTGYPPTRNLPAMGRKVSLVVVPGLSGTLPASVQLKPPFVLFSKRACRKRGDTPPRTRQQATPRASQQ